MSGCWVENVSLTIDEVSLIHVLLRKHLKEWEELLDMPGVMPSTRNDGIENIECVKRIFEKLNMEV